MSVGDLKKLYPTIELMEGYDRAFVGIVPAPDGGCLAVYDSMKIVNMLHKQGFSSQEALLAHFEGMLASAQKTKKVGPLFMQATSIIDPTATEQEDDEVDAFDDDLEWEDSSDSESDSDSDSDHDWNDGDDPGEEGEEGEEATED